mmetsp:Transcript_5157/g.21988  ORF Transcript_5157/g.21988 Transcript_5157/m.21988 type:complete len:212 (+) Transcript_5157:1023-1658(+)
MREALLGHMHPHVGHCNVAGAHRRLILQRLDLLRHAGLFRELLLLHVRQLRVKRGHGVAGDAGGQAGHAPHDASHGAARGSRGRVDRGRGQIDGHVHGHAVGQVSRLKARRRVPCARHERGNRGDVAGGRVLVGVEREGAAVDLSLACAGLSLCLCLGLCLGLALGLKLRLVLCQQLRLRLCGALGACLASRLRRVACLSKRFQATPGHEG